MRVVVYPADTGGCGHFRIIWPAELLRAAGHDVEIRPPADRGLKLRIGADDHAEDVLDVDDADVIVFQRLTHQWMAEAVPLLRAKGVAVVVDIDDDLTTVHPRNPAYDSMHPRNAGRRKGGDIHRHSWQHLAAACREATLVTVSTPALLERYARHGRGHVIYNHLPDHYYGVPHDDSGVIGWPAALASHPDDPSVIGGAVARLVSEGAGFRVVGDPVGVGAAFGLTADPAGRTGVDVNGWPAAVAELGVGIAPLADTRFNAAKSWLKPLEMSALGVPWVASPRAEYVRLHRMGAGVLADTPRRWYRELKRLVDSPALRAERAEEGRAVAEGLRLSRNAWRWWEAWERARATQSAPTAHAA
jgi:hypothetical protein